MDGRPDRHDTDVRVVTPGNPDRPATAHHQDMPIAAFLGAAVFAQQLTLTPTPPPPRADWAGARLHLLEETLRIPFGEDWGGETRAFARFGRLDVGVFARAWSEAVCDRPDCAGRAVQMGAEVKVNVTPALDVGLDLGVGRNATQRGGSMILPRLRLKF